MAVRQLQLVQLRDEGNKRLNADPKRKEKHFQKRKEEMEAEKGKKENYSRVQ